MSKLPSFQFYPGDWLKDPNLRRCTPAAKGVWMDLLCIMFECEERGVLATSGQAWTDDEIARAVGGDRAETLACIEELTLKGVANRLPNGALYSKRMVRDENKRKLCVEAGKRGGNPNLRPPLKGGVNGQSKGQSKGGANPNPTPSSSSSSSSSDNKHEREHAREIPDWKLVKAFADTIGLAEWRAQDWFNEMEGAGWLDYQRRPIVKWQAVLTRVKAKWEADGRPMAPGLKPGQKPQTGGKYDNAW